MGLSVFNAMHDSKTPEDFLDLLLKAVKKRQWDYHVPSGSRLETWEGRESPFVGVAFQSRQNPAYAAYLVLNRRESRKMRETPFEHSELTDPRLVFFNSISVPVHEDDWRQASDRFGNKVERTPGGEVFHKLRFPVKVVRHWAPFSKIKKGGGSFDNIHVEVDGSKLEELERYRRADVAVDRLFHAVRFQRGFYRPEDFERKMKLKNVSFLTGQEPLDKFLSVERQSHQFFRSLSDLIETYPRGTGNDRAVMQFEDALVAHFNLEYCEYTHHLAGTMGSFFQNQENRNAAHEIVGMIRG